MNSIDPPLARLSGELVHTVEVCALGQITACLSGVVGKLQTMV